MKKLAIVMGALGALALLTPGSATAENGIIVRQIN